MFEGRLEGIFITAVKGTPLTAVAEIQAVSGAGLVGDRYAKQEGTFSKPGASDREVTLIEIEAIEAAGSESGMVLSPAQLRRNLITRHVPLNHLVGKSFSVGEVRLRGIRLCEPCGHLEKLTAKGIQETFLHRCGLRAQILTSGTLRHGATIRAD